VACEVLHREGPDEERNTTRRPAGKNNIDVAGKTAQCTRIGCSQETKVQVVETKVQCVSTDSDADDFILRGCNVHVQNGADGGTLR
jgi:hypothetical protein